MEYYLYILMRNDLPSMNPGKACAQAAHASNQFVSDLDIQTPKNWDHVLDMYGEWAKSAKGFGTTIVLEASGPDIADAIECAKSKGYFAAEVWDPTYPFLDGQVIHHVNLMTCAYAFVPKDKGRELFKMPLMR
jgi:peptidyl-tRNA hydrolase